MTCESWLMGALTSLMLLYNLFSPGGNDSACPRHPHCAHPCAVSAPSLSPARQGLHPLVALLAVPALYAGPPPSSADLRGLPGAFLPQGWLQGERVISHLRIQHAIPRDGVHAWWAGVRTAEQRLLVHRPLPHPPSTYSPLTRTQGRKDWRRARASMHQWTGFSIGNKVLLDLPPNFSTFTVAH